MCVCLYSIKLLSGVLEKHEVSNQERARVEVLQEEQGTASKTQANQNRKGRISVLFTDFDRLTVMIDLFRGILNELEDQWLVYINVMYFLLGDGGPALLDDIVLLFGQGTNGTVISL